MSLSDPEPETWPCCWHLTAQHQSPAQQDTNINRQCSSVANYQLQLLLHNKCILPRRPSRRVQASAIVSPAAANLVWHTCCQHSVVHAVMLCPAHLYVWVQDLDVSSNACNEASSTNRDKDGIQLGGVCYLQAAGDAHSRRLQSILNVAAADTAIQSTSCEACKRPERTGVLAQPGVKHNKAGHHAHSLLVVTHIPVAESRHQWFPGPQWCVGHQMEPQMSSHHAQRDPAHTMRQHSRHRSDTNRAAQTMQCRGATRGRLAAPVPQRLHKPYARLCTTKGLAQPG